MLKAVNVPPLILREELEQGVFTVWIRMKIQLLFHLGHQPHTPRETSLYVLNVVLIYRPVTCQIPPTMRVPINHHFIPPQ